MELEFDKRGLPYLKTLLQEIQNQEQTQELRLSDGMPDLGRVLGTWGQVILRSKEWRGDRVSIAGGVMAFILYAPEDGSEPRTLESWIPFQMKWALEDGRREGELRIQCLLRFLDARVVSARKVMLRCGVGAFAQAFRQDSAMISSPGQLPEDVQLLKNRYPLRLPKIAGEKTFQLEEELTLPDMALKTLVSYTLEPRVQECRVVNGRLVFRGNCLLHVVSLGEDGRLAGRDLEVPFSQLAEPEGDLSSDARGDIRMAVTGLELDPEPDGKLRLKANLLAQFLVDDREMVEIAEDAYSTQRKIDLKTEILDLPQILDRQSVEIPVRQSLHQDAAQIGDVTYLPDFPVQGGSVRIELPGQFQVLWYDDNGMLQSSTARSSENWDLPAGEDTRIQATVLPGSGATASESGGLELKGESILEMISTTDRGLSMITGLELGEEMPREPNRPSLILRRAGDADLWQIAKSTGSTICAIRKANDLETEPARDQILLIPVS